MTSGSSRLRRHRERANRWAFDQRALARRPHLIALGDSHVSVVAYAAKYRSLRALVSVCAIPGATAQGLHNPNSRTNALPALQRRCDQARAWQRLVFMLGEVDCGFVIWYRAEKHGVSIESQMRRSIDAYVALLDRQVKNRLPTMVLSVPLPTIRDGQDWGEVANARREVKASLRDRTNLTLEYNTRLSSACAQIGATFLDVTTPTLDSDTGLLLPEYFNPTPTDHHLHPERYATVVGTVIEQALSEAGRA